DVAWGTDVPAGTVESELAGLVDRHLGHVRTHFGRFSRQVSGYALEHLLPERGRRWERFLVGSEGTLAVVTEATVALVPEEPRRLVVLGYPSMAEAADAVPTLLAAREHLVACEGLDARIVDLTRASGRTVPELPRGRGWLFVEVTGEEEVPAAGELARRVVADPAEAAALWQIREAGAGLASRSLSRPAHAGWEDAAVPPERLGAWLRDFEELLSDFGLETVPYGHFGDGCVHARIDFEFDDAGRRRFREFLVACATRLRDHGGSLSGEHGDGRARSELLPLMYDEQSLALFAEVKRICDPAGVLNPGVLVDPAPVDDDLRLARPVAPVRTGLRLVHDDSFGAAVHRCTGVGACVAPVPRNVMCPSWVATREEKDSTRGRARVLQEALDGSLVDDLRHPAVTDALDLCLACKGCATDCPTGVDMATYKAEVLHQQYAGRRRPRSHYTLGRLPQWLGRAPGWGRRLAGLPPVAAVAKAAAGVDRRRSLPPLAPQRLGRDGEGPQPDVWLWGDTFTDHFGPGIAAAAVTALAAAGLRARVVPEEACCGLTWLTTGQLDQARERIRRTIATLAPYLDSGVQVVGLEPSCLATLRTDAAELTDDPRAAAVAAGVLTFAELVERLDLPVPDLTGTEVVAQPHCHHASVLGWEADERLLRRAGARVTRVPGCCGLAGNFGMEKGHYDVSVAVAESHLLPAVRSHPGAVVLADGLSCRHQLADLEGVEAVHLAQLWASATSPLPGSADR
ncbi:MAG TPA: FAD-linked oxidase C-terminal domain-containing protein, partial [Nocardioides sp.]|nr:FAD-linked oxidase C-terminal domain-containing protein [Nocardioides sp.]